MRPISQTISAGIYRVLIFISALYPGLSCIAGETDTIKYLGEIRATFSGGENTPFWLVNNLGGLGSPEKNNGFVRAAAFRELNREKRFSWGAGVDIAGAWRATSPFYIHQLYGEVRYRSLGAMLGSKEIAGEFNNPRLSSGNLLYSGNSLPIPQLRLGIFDYADFWGCRGWLAVKGYISYGMFTDSGWQKSWVAENSKHTKGVLYHSKGIWLRGGNPEKFPLIGEIGIEMATQFGGKSFVDGKVIKMPTGFRAWWKAMFPSGGGSQTPDSEQTNVEGNMIGAYNFALSWLPSQDWSVKAYYQHLFEDHSQLTLEYGWKDGLWGIEFQAPKNPVVSRVVYEFLYLKDQSGPVYNDSSPAIPEQVSGRDFYYDHYIYSGWQHWGMGIGNPLALSPIYNRNRHLTFLDTRVVAHHFGIGGNPTPDLDYRILLSFSRNWGTYMYPYPEVLDNFNALVELTWRPAKFNGWFGKLGVATDSGKLLGNSFGAMLTIGKAGLLEIPRKKKAHNSIH